MTDDKETAVERPAVKLFASPKPYGFDEPCDACPPRNCKCDIDPYDPRWL